MTKVKIGTVLCTQHNKGEILLLKENNHSEAKFLIPIGSGVYMNPTKTHVMFLGGCKEEDAEIETYDDTIEQGEEYEGSTTCYKVEYNLSVDSFNKVINKFKKLT